MNERAAIHSALARGGQDPEILDALTNSKTICEERLLDQHQVEVVDLIERPALAKNQIVAIPTPVRRLPPVKKIVGDLSNKERVLMALELEPVEA